VRIGRDDSNDCQLAFNLVSRFHARIELEDDALFLRDEGSSHGTFVNGDEAPMKARHLVNLTERGGEFRIAALSLRAVLVDSDDPRCLFDDNATTHLLLDIDPNATRAYDEAHVDPAALDADTVERSVRASVDAYVRAREDLSRSVQAATNALDRDRRIEMFDALLARYPALLQEEAFCALVDRSAVRARVSPEADLALRGLQEISALYVPYAPPLTQTDSVAAFLVRLEDTLRVLFEGLAALRNAYRSQSAHPVSPSGNADVGAQLLDWTDPKADGRRALEQELVDIATHHGRLVSEAVWGVQRMLAELAPARIEESVRCERGRLSLFRFRAQWEAYEYRFKHILMRTASLRTMFGRTFAMAAAALAGEQMPPTSTDEHGGNHEASGPRLAAHAAAG
jgi:predicted component of type VI protein secretion system